MSIGAPPRPSGSIAPTRRAVLAALAIDVGCTVAFAAAGRQSHDETTSAGSILATAAPFVLALGLGWLVLRAWRRPAAVATGVMLWPITVAVGMLLRRTVFDRGTAISFVVVATVFIGLYLVGWRLVAREISARRQIDDANEARLG